MQPSERSTKRTFARFLLQLCPLLIVVFGALALNSQEMQKGVSVEMAPTRNAHPAPAADEESAWIITITNDGRLWFGTDPMTPDSLADKMVRTSHQHDQNLYIKADARTPYAAVESALRAAHTAEFDSAVLLTDQRQSAQTGRLISPQGLDVSVESGAIRGPKPAEIDLSSGSQTVKVNNQQMPVETLPQTLKKLFQNQVESTVLLKADGDLPFSRVIQIIDVCRSTGAKVVLFLPQI